MGCKRLRKNMVNGVNTLTQNMLKDEYTCYIIKYDYDLHGAEITIPEGCILDFQGGRLINGNIVFNNTYCKKPNFFKCRFSGNSENYYFNIEDYGAIRGEDSTFDNAIVINDLLNIANKNV